MTEFGEWLEKTYRQDNCVNRVTDPKDPVQICEDDDMCAICRVVKLTIRLEDTVFRYNERFFGTPAGSFATQVMDEEMEQFRRDYQERQE